MPSDVQRQDSPWPRRPARLLDEELAQAAERYDAAVILERGARAALAIGSLTAEEVLAAQRQRERFGRSLRLASARLRKARRR